MPTLLFVTTYSGSALVTLASADVELSASNPSASIQLTAGNDDLCSSDHRYRLSYTYTGPNAYTVLSDLRGQVDLQLEDGELKLLEVV